jgi:hypothetical protein
VGLTETLEGGEDAQFTADVKHLVDYAVGKLLLIRETFPDYTLHDRQHAQNVVSLIEKLLGDDIGKLTQLEAGMLILAAYFHDIGMVYTPAEVHALLEEQEFKSYLDRHPSAFVRVVEADEVPRDIVLDYCRARHADRVSEHLHQLDPGRLAWRGVPITEELVTVCRSHNESLATLRSEAFETDFLTGCDLRLCAILLRAADLLDFDPTRSPIAVYEHLRLDEAEGSRKFSQTEWAKHMASLGFVFPADRTSGYAVKLIASPKQPAVESAIRKFLDVVEDELRGCRDLLDFCAPRWRSLSMPGSVDRSGIRSQGYRWGDYRFDLDRHAVLQLFMGDRLYANPYVFIRELLQNAIDACRLNAYLHDLDPDEMEVRISVWEDSAGNYWFRVDDNGVGMDQHIIEKYFLGVGRSYYNSDELRADILKKQKPDRKFVSISRFGIGVLSTFIVGDRIEVSTRRRLPGGELVSGIRLSLNSLDDFFVLREQPMRSDGFPVRKGGESDYRKSSGTSIAVRINPAKSDVDLNALLSYVDDCLFYPPVRVYVNDSERCSQRFFDLSEPILGAPVKYVVSSSKSGGLRARSGGLTISKVTLTALPVDLTKNSPTAQLQGQLIAIVPSVEPAEGRSNDVLGLVPDALTQRIPPGLLAVLKRRPIKRTVSVDMLDTSEARISLTVRFDQFALNRLVEFLERHPEVLNEFKMIEPESILFDKLARPKGTIRSEVRHGLTVQLSDVIGANAIKNIPANWLGHNGVRVSVDLDNNGDYGSHGRLTLAGQLFLGAVCLSDDLRPEVSVSRDSIRFMPFDIHSAVRLAVRRSVVGYLGSENDFHAKFILGERIFPEVAMPMVTAGDIAAEPLIEEWCKEDIIPYGESSFVSYKQLRQAVVECTDDLGVEIGPWLSDSIYFGASRRGFYATLAMFLLERGFDLEIRPVGDPGYFRRLKFVARRLKSAQLDGVDLLPPLAGVECGPSTLVIRPGMPANLANPIVRWYFENAKDLYLEYPAIFAQIKRALAGLAGRGLDYPAESDKRSKEGVELIKLTMGRIRQTFSDLPQAFYREVRLSEDGALVQDS